MKAIQCQSYTEAKAAGPGAWWWATKTLIHFFCPCGCGAMLGIDATKWRVTGDGDSITATPSVLHMDGCRWHGYLTKGEWKSV